VNLEVLHCSFSQRGPLRTLWKYFYRSILSHKKVKVSISQFTYFYAYINLFWSPNDSGWESS